MDTLMCVSDSEYIGKKIEVKKNQFCSKKNYTERVSMATSTLSF